MASKEKIEEPIVLPKLNIQEMRITLIGDSPLICHAWSEKAKKQILDKQQKKARQARAAKDPQRDFEESLYRHPEGGYGFPAVAFKAAAVDACSHVEGITKVQARGAFHIVGELARLDGEPRMRADMVRVGLGTADIRIRAEFPAWSTTLDIRYNGNVLSMEQIANLFNTAGFAVGVGEWRPQKDGSYGMFHAEA
ncbi:hypothetical protein [Syntrophobacter fumaroxidans]|uniref:Uncharacterized protein n=1 Tax=Syntrophobacter fumaroxidans (strain DSM 10017 / MPOB) TaxID=335543 RepID=A0LJH9_SYNFM|nr:hypothetical protein [Syntrophobacter fumaroxidans]ABK17581.1 hypothetical protein Sfum_1896 [Syntrophobacter fumaroxidans MPOB]